MAWSIMLLAAAFEAYARRHSMTPDGVSYLDLSDAVVAGHWSGLVDGYWSPLYPLLIGLARLLSRPAPAGEFAVVHALNFALFALTIPAFEWFLAGLMDRARDWRRSPIHRRWASAGAYLVFGTLSLTMTPLELPTPDLVVSGALFLAFGAVLRIDMGLDLRRNALILGAALAVATLTKSFYVPWSAICLGVVALGTVRRHGKVPVALAAAVWLLVAVPWCLAVSSHVGHLSFGETGRLTYAWFVNKQEPPAILAVPTAAATPASNALLPGVAVTRDAPGTNPVWRDPVRFSGGLRPHWDLADQIDTEHALIAYYVRSLAPLIFAALFAIVVADRGARALAWRRGWMIWVPSLVGFVAYGAVVVTTRYVVAFLIADLALLAAALPWPRRISERRALLAVLLPLVVIGSMLEALNMLALINALVMALALAYILRDRPVLTRALLVLFGAFVIRVGFSPVFPTVVRACSLLLVVAFWLLAKKAGRANDARRFATVTGQALAVCTALLISGRTVLRLYDDFHAIRETNPASIAAHRLAEIGVPPGSRVALIGSPYDAYWARTARISLAAVVPPPAIDGFWKLPPARRDSLLALFAANGATFAIATYAPRTIGADTTWRPTGVGGWVRVLRR